MNKDQEIKEKKLEWINLRDNCCPKCSGILSEFKNPNYFKCLKCNFLITEIRYAEILENMLKTKKWRSVFKDETEDNLSALNNL